MRNRDAGIDEFKLVRALGAIAAAVALYGIMLVVVALLESPAEASAPGLTALGAASAKPGPHRAGRGISFWNGSASSSNSTRPDEPARGAARRSFWHG